MARWEFTKGLQNLGNGCWGYILPDGSWGLSNAGLIEDSGQTLLVDTLFDLKLTAEMLDVMRRAVPAAQRIDTLVNTHANGDHTFGNELVKGARILTTAAIDASLEHIMPDTLADRLDRWRQGGEGGAFMHQVFRGFDFRGITITHATETFEGSLTLNVGRKSVQLVDVGPAHTASDVLVHVPEDRVVFTGDILFSELHPAIWAGPVRNWIKACDLILSWDIETVVPGHGPITDKAGVRAFKGYLEYLWAETKSRYDAGMTWLDTAFDIGLGTYGHWRDPERIVPNVIEIWGELSGSRPTVAFEELWAHMARYHKVDSERRAAECGCNDIHHTHELRPPTSATRTPA